MWLSDRSRNKHSSFSTTFPIYLHTTSTKYVPDEETEVETEEKEKDPEVETDDSTVDEDEAVVEDVTEEEEKPKTPKVKAIEVEEWVRLNSQPPIWMRLVYYRVSPASH